MGLTLHSPTPETTQTLAAALARQCAAGDCILLVGDLGSGKTTFARGFIRAICGEQEVVSPTFTLAQYYQARDGATVWHFDLYRLKRPEETLEIGLEEALSIGITLIEWPELIQDRLPANALNVRFAHAGESARTITLSGEDATWKERLETMENNR